jgi:hypothetical protein
VSHVEQVGCKALWSVSASFVTEPFAYISKVGESFKVEDVEDGPLGWRRTLDDAIALADRDTERCQAEQEAHNDRVLAEIAGLDRAA